MDRPERKGVRAQRDQLLTLINGWDPVGLIAGGAPRTAYEVLVDELLAMLSGYASKEDIAEFLDGKIREQFGRTPEGTALFVTKAVTWFEIG